MASTKKILPEDGKRNILITSALPYVNNVPHLGNIIGSVLSADVFARYSRCRGINTLFICGTDEYGTATETKAIEEGLTPQELCDKYHKLHTEVYEWFRISFDKWGRTPTQQQTDIAQEMFLKLNENGYLREKTTTQPYCETHHAFLADRFVEGECPTCGYADARGDQCDKCGRLLDPLELINPKCKLDGTTPVPRETKHIYIELNKLEPEIKKWFLESSKKGAWSQNGISITQDWLNKGLEERGITRDLKWGTAVPLPGYESKVLYVWFDACIGYVSITATYTDEWEKWWRNPENVQLYQFLGKDNVPFHTVIFPGSQIGGGQKWTMLHHLSTTEYLNYEKGKFSKSRGVGVFGNNAKQTGIGPDIWRYYLLSHRPESGDSEFEWQGFIDSNNNELLKNLGNFINRIVKFLNSKAYDSVVPDYKAFNEPALEEHKKATNAALQEYLANLEAVKLKAGLADIMRISALGNKLLQDNHLDNKLLDTNPDKCAAVVGLAINHVHLLSSILAPYMPETAASILEQLKSEPLQIPDKYDFDTIGFGHTIGKAAYLFSIIKAEKEKEWRELFGGEEARKQREEAAAKTAAKKAEKEKKQAKKASATATATAAAATAASAAASAANGEASSQSPVLSRAEEAANKAAKKAAKKEKREKGKQGPEGGIGEVTEGLKKTEL